MTSSASSERRRLAEILENLLEEMTVPDVHAWGDKHEKTVGELRKELRKLEDVHDFRGADEVLSRRQAGTSSEDELQPCLTRLREVVSLDALSYVNGLKRTAVELDQEGKRADARALLESARNDVKGLTPAIQELEKLLRFFQ